MRPSLLGAALLAVFCGCAEIAAQTAGDRAGYIEWSATRRLTIADFKGKIPSRAYESSSSWVEIEVSWECTGGEASSAATAVFDPARSWWKDISPSLWRNTDAPSLIVPRDEKGTALLAHEQAHFDLTELWARKIRALFKNLAETCKTSRVSPSFEYPIAALERDWHAEQERYDRETGNGTDRGRQRAWAEKVEKALRESYSAGANVPAAR